MADSYVRVPADSGGKKVDATSLDVGADTVYRQRIVIGDNSATAQFAVVTAGALLTTGTFNLSGTATIAGTVNLSGTAVVAGTVNISNTASVVLAAGTSNIGLLNSISRTVNVALSTPFTVDNISATVQVAIGTPFTVNNVSATVQVAIATPFTINNISATVNVAFASAINISNTASVVLAAGTANIGTINNISGTVQVAIATPFTINNISATVSVVVTNATTTATVVIGTSPFMALPSASHGPKNVVASTSAAVALIADPGASNSIYITQIMAGNFGSTLTRARIGTSASPSYVVQALAANGGGFVLNFDPPWKLSANSTAICSVKPNVSEVNFTVNFYVAAT